MSHSTDRDTRLHRFIAAAIGAPIALDVAALMAERDELKRRVQSEQRRAEEEHAAALAAVAALRQSEQRAQDAGQLVSTVAAERDQFAQALLTYAVHPYACASWRLVEDGSVSRPCNCGLADALGQALGALAGVKAAPVSDAHP